MNKLRFIITTDIEIDLDLYRVETLEEAAQQQQDEWDNEELKIKDILEAGSNFKVKVIAIKGADI